MSRPLDRNCKLPPLGKIDHDAGEFWVANPFMMPNQGKNLSAYERNCFYLNRQGRDFLDGSFASNADIDADSRSVVAADFNNDGAPDVLVGSVGGGSLRLFLNRLPQGNRVHLDLTGKTSNRSAIGTRVTVSCGERTMVRELFAHNSFMGQAPATLSLGVGEAKTIDKMSIRWPTGETQVFRDVPVGKHIVLEEGQTEYQVKIVK